MLLALFACTPGTVELGKGGDDPAETPPALDYDALCPSTAGSPDEVALWSATGNELSFVRMDGTVEPAWTFFAGRGEGSVLVGASARGDRIVATATWYAGNWPDNELATELVAFDREGAVAWTHVEEAVYAPTVHIGADGLVAWDRGYASFDAANPHLAGRVFGPDGTGAELPGWPVGAPIDGAVPTCDGGWCGWADATGAFLGELRPEFEVWRTVVGDRLLEVSLDGRTVGVLAENRDESVFLEVEGAARLDDIELLDVEGAYALLRVDGALVWFDAESATLMRVALDLPAGLRPFEDADYCEARPPALTEDGDLLLALRDDARGSLWRTDPAGTRWEELGAGVTDVLWLSGEAIGETTVISAVSWAETYCPDLPWSDSPAHAGSWTQLVRGDTVVPVDADVLPAWGGDVALSADGACALLPDGDARAVLDLETGLSTPVEAGGWLLER